MGNAIRLGTDSSFWIVDTSPTESGHGCPLWFSTFCLLYIFGIICNVFSMDFEPYKTTLNQLLFFFNEKFSEENLQETDLRDK